MKGYKNTTKTVYETESSANFAKGGKAMAKVGKVMGEFKAGALHSGSKKGPAVTNRKQAIAIGLSEARKAGAKIPMRKAEGGAVEVDLPTRAEPLKAQGLSSPKLPRVDDSRDFSTAFREARSAGDKTFSWRGKTYTTQLASETRSTPEAAAAAPAPKAAAAPAPKAAAAPAPKAAAAPVPKAAAAPKAKPSFGQRVRDSYQSKEENDKEWSDRFSGVKDYLTKGDPKYRGMSRKDAFRAAFRDSMRKADGGAVKSEPTSRAMTADEVRNVRNMMKANPPKTPKRETIGQAYSRMVAARTAATKAADAKRGYDPVKDEPTSRAFKKGGIVEKGSGEVYKSKASMKRHEAKESPAKERAEHKQTGGLMAERQLGAREMVGKAKGGAVAAVHKHERNMHPGKPLTKMRYGGKVGC